MIEKKRLYCRVCEAACGLIASVDKGKLAGVAGDPDHPISKGYICKRGKLTVNIHHDPDRVRRPLKRVDGRFVPVTWADALADVGRRLAAIREKHGRHAVAFYFGNPIAFDFPFSVYLPFALSTLGTSNVYSSGSQDCNNKFVVGKMMYGSPMLHPVPDVERTDFLILIGTNPAVSSSSFISFARPIERLRKIVDRGGRVIIVDPRRTETVRQVGEHLAIKPDADVFFLLALLNVILEEGLYDRRFIDAHARGFEDLRAFCSGWTPEKVAAVVGVEAGRLRALARDFARAYNGSIHASVGLNLGSHGTIAYWLVQALLAVTGRLDRRGSMIFAENLINVPRLYKGSPANARARRVSRVGGYPPVMGTIPAGVMADEMLTEGERKPRALIVASGNPMLSVPDPNRLGRALSGLELAVSLDLYVNETGAFCDYVLPGRDMYERWDFAATSLAFNPVHFANYADPIVAPAAEEQDTWIALHQILKAAGYELGGSRNADRLVRGLDRIGGLLGARAPWGYPPYLIMRLMLALGGASFSKLQAGPGLLLPEHQTGSFFKKRILTPDRKINLAPPELCAERAELERVLEAERGFDGFKLICQRQKITHNTWFHNHEEMVAAEGTNRALINPADADRLGIEDGETVAVESESGRLELPARVSDEVGPGVIAIPHGWGHDLASGLSVAKKYPGVNVNVLTAAGAGKLEKFAGMAKLTGVRVKVGPKAR